MDVMLQRVLELVGEHHGSGQDLVRAIGCRKNAVTDWRAGRSKSYTKYAPQIADYFGVSLDWLSGLTDDKQIKKASSEDEAEDPMIPAIVELLRSMSPDEVSSWFEVMRKSRGKK